MLSAKLKEDEMGDDEEEEMSMEDEMGDEEEEGIPAEEGTYEDEEMDDEETMEIADEDEFGGEEEPEVEEDEVASAMEDEMGDEEDEGEEKLDLEAIIKELESELHEEDDAYDETASPEKDGLAEEDDAYDEPASKEDKNDGKSSSTLAEQEDEEDEEEPVEEQSDSSDIGNGDNKGDYADAGDEEDPGKGEMHEVKAELKEYKEAVRFLKDKLHEVNILNAKLLFTNKLFKEFALNNNQKLKVVETFDRAQTTREIKLVYSTLCEQFMGNGSINRKKSINESASSSVKSTKPSQGSRKVITEESQVADRFKKLAGIIK